MRNLREARAAMAIAGALLGCACTDVQNKRASGMLADGDAGNIEPDSEREQSSSAGKSAMSWPEGGGRGGAGGRSAAGSSAESGAGGAGVGGDSGVGGGGGGAAANGGGGAGGSTPSASGPVRGTLIDALRRPLPNVELQIGEQKVTTDGVGKFTVEGVGATYDVAFRLMTVSFRDGAPLSSVWRFEGLTRRDPTLQVYPTLELQGTNVTFHNGGATFPLPEDHRMQAAIGSPNGECGTGVNTEVYEFSGCYWDGPPMTTATAHGIWYSVSGEDDLPLEYLGHDSTPTSLAARVTSEIRFDFSQGKPPMGSITGRVNAVGQGARSNWIVLRWTDGSSMLLGADENASETFSYFIPTIPEASSAVVALRGRNFEYPLAVAFADNVSPGQTGIQLEVPQSASVIAPGDNQTNIDGNTMFQWSGDAKVFVFVAETADFKELMHVVTSSKRIRLPVVPAAPYTPPAGAQFKWHVETHGDYASMDEAAGPEGLISAFFANRLQGPRRGPGSYTASAQRTFTTAN